MIYRSTLFYLLLTSSLGIALFHIKYQVIKLENMLSSTHKELFRTEEAIHLLHAEWAYLNDPKRLKILASKHLKMNETTPLQMVGLESEESSVTISGNDMIKDPIVIKWQGPQ
ncbi:MAG: hypothetical protein IBJ00_00425 [Alphaproteobacteria bacterium]|nr:hypothetical protein [Alphaproteobacteria bacterium]